jgi:hypothetical protein
MDEQRETVQIEEMAGTSMSGELRQEDNRPRQPSVWESYSLNILTAFFDD